jgi:hypothetical protein
MAEDAVKGELLSAKNREIYRETPLSGRDPMPATPESHSAGYNCAHHFEPAIKSDQGITGNLTGIRRSRLQNSAGLVVVPKPDITSTSVWADSIPSQRRAQDGRHRSMGEFSAVGVGFYGSQCPALAFRLGGLTDACKQNIGRQRKHTSRVVYFKPSIDPGKFREGVRRFRCPRALVSRSRDTIDPEWRDPAVIERDPPRSFSWTLPLRYRRPRLRNRGANRLRLGIFLKHLVAHFATPEGFRAKYKPPRHRITPATKRTALKRVLMFSASKRTSPDRPFRKSVLMLGQIDIHNRFKTANR